MQKIIVSDTSCLILFYKIGKLDLLNKVFGRITITNTVAIEYKRNLPDWIQIQDPSSNLHLGLKGFLDPGEATSIGLASEFKDSLLIIDEAKGRKLAKELGISLTGSFGILISAKKKGIIPQVKPLIKKIQETNFRLSEELIDKVLQLANEK